MTTTTDTFEHLAKYYDIIMAHVDYDRWYMATLELANLLPKPFVHLDAACGTCVLLGNLEGHGWTSFGADLSYTMMRQGQKWFDLSVAVADLRAIPMSGSLDYITCLFDSVNFLLEEEGLRQTFREFFSALRPGGLLYFDIVTERMVLEHFAGHSWHEKNGGTTFDWDCTYNRRTTTAETRITIGDGTVATIYERMYDPKLVEQAVTDAGFELLAVVDAETWRAPRKRTVRIDFVAVKGRARSFKRGFKKVQTNLHRLLGK